MTPSDPMQRDLFTQLLRMKASPRPVKRLPNTTVKLHQRETLLPASMLNIVPTHSDRKFGLLTKKKR